MSLVISCGPTPCHEPPERMRAAAKLFRRVWAACAGRRREVLVAARLDIIEDLKPRSR